MVKGVNMKKSLIGIVALGLLVAGSIFAVAQMSGSNDRGPMGFGMGRGHNMAMPLRGLDLTEEQKVQVKQIIEQSRSTIEPLERQMHDGRTKLADLSQTGSFDQAQVDTLASEQGRVVAAMIVERQKTRAAIFSLLNDEQKAKAAEMHKTMTEKRRHRRGHRPELAEE